LALIREISIFEKALVGMIEKMTRERLPKSKSIYKRINFHLVAFESSWKVRVEKRHIKRFLLNSARGVLIKDFELIKV